MNNKKLVCPECGSKLFLVRVIRSVMIDTGDPTCRVDDGQVADDGISIYCEECCIDIFDEMFDRLRTFWLAARAREDRDKHHAYRTTK